MKKIFLQSFIVGLTILFFTACSLTEMPVSQGSSQAVFGSKEGLELYTNSFYELLPNNDVGVFQDDDNSDLVARYGIDAMIATNQLGPTNTSGWSWSNLRNINFFIENAEKSTVPEKNHYIGLARFFRAYWYFGMVQRYGDVPWIDKPIDVKDEEKLYAPRDSRFTVMDKVLEDLNFAISNITTTADNGRSLITANVVRAYKTRICLYEASIRKYHTRYGQQATAAAWYQEVVTTAGQITGFSLNTAGATPYRSLFIGNTPLTNETILAIIQNGELKVYSSVNRRFISPTYGNRPALTRRFINHYLNADGTRFTDNPNYVTTEFKDEVKNRDGRLKQTIRMGDYRRTENGVSVVAAPNFNQSITGYQPIKLTVDERFPFDDESMNVNPHIIMRWAEVLLNKAEALAELGQMDAASWASTIGLLRIRAGIDPTAANTLPTVADPYLVSCYRKDDGTAFSTDPILLEVIRERTVEMIFEGLRRDDLIRWRMGGLLATTVFNGMYVPELNVPMDLNEDGIMDVVFYKGTRPSVTATVFVDVSSSAADKTSLSEDTKGEVRWNKAPRDWPAKKYLYPIPETDVIKNPALGQNPEWD